MSIHSWPEFERPREKLIQRGAAALSDAELIAIIINCGSRSKSALDLARDLLSQHQSLRKLLHIDLKSWLQHDGIGVSKYAQIQAALEIGKRCLSESLSRGNSIHSPQQVAQYFQVKLQDFEQEVFAVLFLDNKHRIIQFEVLFHGSINSAEVHPREVVKRALYHNAAAVIIGHNHPSGVVEPSQADIAMTEMLTKTLALVEVRLLDHFIVGEKTVYSFTEQGLIRISTAKTE